MQRGTQVSLIAQLPLSPELFRLITHWRKLAKLEVLSKTVLKKQSFQMEKRRSFDTRAFLRMRGGGEFNDL